jgi:nucleoside-diphosphate-sugar epimerase
MTRRIFIAGATGAIGRPLCHLLVADGWQVTGTTRSEAKAQGLEAMGVTPAIVDVYDDAALHRAVATARPDVVMHQLTDLPLGLDPAKMAEGRQRNARIREIGTRNLVAAAVAAGAGRMVAQSIAFAYAPCPMPYGEDAPLDPSATAVASLERQVLDAPLEGIVLRYGKLHGPGTGFDAPQQISPLHVDAAADAARRAATRGTGIYNVAADDGTVSIGRAVEQLGWNPDFRIG